VPIGPEPTTGVITSSGSVAMTCNQPQRSVSGDEISPKPMILVTMIRSQVFWNLPRRPNVEERQDIVSVIGRIRQRIV
jgi:hypothetical protein